MSANSGFQQNRPVRIHGMQVALKKVYSSILLSVRNLLDHSEATAKEVVSRLQLNNSPNYSKSGAKILHEIEVQCL